MGNNLIITSSRNKNMMLEDVSKKLVNRMFMSFDDMLTNMFFEIDKRLIYEIMKSEKVPCETAFIMARQLYFLDKNVNTFKVNKLRKIYRFLESKGFLKKNDFFLSYLKDAYIVINDRDFLSREEEAMLSGLKYSFSDRKKYDRDIPLYKYDTLEEEVDGLARRVVNLIKCGVSPKFIRIINLNDEYRMSINKIFKWYNIPSNISIDKNLYSLYLSKIFLDSNSLQDGLINISKEVKDQRDREVYEKILSIANKYVLLPEDDISKEMIVYDFKNTNISVNNIKDAVMEGDISDVYGEDFYVFIVGLNQGLIPKIYKDEDYLSDYEKELLGRDTSFDKNLFSKRELHYFLDHTKNVVISYKKRSLSEEYYPSPFLDEIKYKIMEDDESYQNSHFVNKIKLSEMLDDYYKYNIKNKDMNKLLFNYGDLKYGSYSNKFSGISLDKIENFYKDGLVLSYSSLDIYNRCAFRYYLQNVLKLREYEESFAIKIGKLFHYILSKAFLDGFSFSDEWDFYVLENFANISKKENFFLTKLKDEILFVIDEINRHNGHSSFNKAFYEEEIILHPTKEDNVVFKGFVDKILYDEVNNLVVPIDYKTGNVSINIKNVIYGLEMQLPIYLYLISRSDKFKSANIVGFYIQNIIHNEISKDDKINYINQKQKNLRLNGFTLGDEKVIAKFDDSYVSSEVISGMKVSSKGFYPYSKVLSKDEISKLIDIVNNNVLSCISEVKHANYSINPKRIGDKMKGCQFCHYKDICFYTERDVVNLSEKSLEEVFGGEK